MRKLAIVALALLASTAAVTPVDAAEFTPSRWRITSTAFDAANIYLNACDVQIKRRGALKGTCGTDLPGPRANLNGRLRLRGDETGVGAGVGSFKVQGAPRCSRVTFAINETTFTAVFTCPGTIGTLTGIRTD